MTLEGIEFRVRDADSDSTALVNPSPVIQRLAAEQMRERMTAGVGIPALLQVRAGDLVVRNCRFVTSVQEARPVDGVLVVGSRRAEFTGCEFYTLASASIRWRAGGNRGGGGREPSHLLSVSNCLFFTLRPLVFAGMNPDLQVRLTQNTFISGVLLTAAARGFPAVTATRNVFAVRSLFDPRPGMSPLWVHRWQEEENVFANPMSESAARDWVPPKVGEGSRVVQLGFHERMWPHAAEARRITPDDFGITPDDAKAAAGLSFAELREYGCRPETVGPGARTIVKGQQGRANE